VLRLPPENDLAVPPIAVTRRAVGALPRGALQVGGGLLVLGASSYGFLVVAARSLSPQSFAGLSVLYVLVYTIGPGLFLPFEQEIGRALADRRARGLGGAPLLRRALWLALGMVAVVLAVVGTAGSQLIHRLFDGSWWLLAGLLLSTAGLCAAHLSRGAFAGSGRFGAYGGQLATEGVTRFLACAVLAVTGVHAVGAYGLLLGGAFVASVVATVAFLPRLTDPGPQAHWDELTSAIGWLVAGSLLAQVLVNAGPVAVKVLETSGERSAAGQLLAGLVLARLPLFLFAAVQAALLPRLAALIARGEVRQFRSGLARLLAAVAGLGLTTTAVLAAAGPEILRVVFGSRFHLARLDLVLLSAGTGLFMAANVLGNALLALQRFALAAAGWAAGVLLLGILIVVPGPLFPRVERSFLIGAAACALTLGLLLRAALAHHRPSRTTARHISDVVTGP
jgi:O-antigen/teichoic acid export membrane protein